MKLLLSSAESTVAASKGQLQRCGKKAAKTHGRGINGESGVMASISLAWLSAAALRNQ